MFVAEYGADAFNANLPGYDPESQAVATVALTRELLEPSNGRDGSTVLGATSFEWADEWRKDEAGRLDVQDVGGIAPGAGPYPDQVSSRASHRCGQTPPFCTCAREFHAG